MPYARLASQTNAQYRPNQRAAAPQTAGGALADLLSRLPASMRPRALASAHAAVRENAREAESPRCPCGGTCPRCQAKTTPEQSDAHSEHEAVAHPIDEHEGSTGESGVHLGEIISGLLSVFGEEDPIVEYSNGTTSCDRDSGTMTTSISNTECTRPCTEAHEADHRAYRSACCRSYATARSAAITAGNTTRRNELTRRYNGWVSATSDFSECRAYRVSVTCGERMESDLGCSTLTDENRTCCGHVRSYLSSMRASRDSHCPGTDQACPDFS
jgi:hypothetical protein